MFGSRTTLLPLAVPLTGLVLDRDQLRGRQWCGLPVAGLRVLPQLLVKVGQLLVELAPSLYELVEARPLLGISGVVTWHWLWVEDARG
jgi:hypothetical protein